MTETPCLTAARAPEKKPAARRPPIPDSASFTFVVVRTEEELAAHRAAWDDLAGDCLEPNPFYESWMLLPALRAFGAGVDLLFVLVYAPSPDRNEPVLCGFFPFQRCRGYKGLPVGYLSLWRHLMCFLCVPLLRRSCARGCLDACMDWAAADPIGATLIEWSWAPGDGPVWQALVDVNLRRSRLSCVVEQYTRGICRPRADAETYLAVALSGDERKKLRQKEKRLLGEGRLECRVTRPGDDFGPWIEAFLRLEASGWKGREGSAMAARPEDAEFFRSAAAGAAQHGRLHMLGLFLDDRPIALKCNFLAGTGAFGFKIAFDETLGRHSPGYQMEVAAIRELHERSGIEWMDSCTDCNPSQFDVLYLDRRVIQTVLLSTGRRTGDLVVSILPLLRWVKRLFRRSWPAANPAKQSN